MGNSVLKLDISNTSGAVLHDYLVVDIEVKIMTKEAIIKSATMCTQNTKDCPERSSTATDVTKTVTSVFYISNNDDIVRLIITGDGDFSLWLKGNEEPNATSYDVFLTNSDTDGYLVNYTAWDIKLRNKPGSRLFIFIYDVLPDDVKEIHALLTVEQNLSSNKSSSGCDTLDLSGTVLKMASLNKDGRYVNPKSSKGQVLLITFCTLTALVLGKITH